MSEGHLYASDDVTTALGVSEEKLARMGLREFFDLCDKRGYRPVILKRGIASGLTISMDQAPSPPTEDE